MPLFSFISGYFSKDVDKSRATAFEKFLLPCLIFQAIFTFAVTLITKEDASLLNLHNAYWYLFSMFIWKILIKDLARVKLILPISIIATLLAGLDSAIGSFLSISRMLGFLPFFLLGYFYNDFHKAMVKKIPKILCILFLVLSGVIIITMISKGYFPYQLLYFDRAYSELGLSNLHGAMYRFLVMIIAALMCICVLNLMTPKKLGITKMGEYTLYIYLAHIYFMAILSRIKFIHSLNHILILIICLVVSILIMIIFGNSFIDKLYKLIMGWICKVVFHNKSNKPI